MSVTKRPRLVARPFLPVQQHEVILPSYSAWFDLSTIHQNEIRGLPEFFNNKNKSKTPRIYKEYRDFMVNTYRLNPLEYLTVTACRRNMTGDVCTIIRVHGFLEQWGLINYQMDPTAKPTAVGPPFTGQIKIIAQLSQGLSSESEPFNSPTPNIDVEMNKSAQDSAVLDRGNVEKKLLFCTNLDLRDDIYDSQQNKVCGSCNKTRYEGYQNKSYFVCLTCFEADQLPEGEKKDEYKRKQDWTEQEDMLLLEGLDMFPTDWDKIAEHVSSKNREACILRYLKLPTSDPRVDPEIKQSGLFELGVAKVDNPIMSVVAFLAANVKPEVGFSTIHEPKERNEDVEMEDTTEQETRQLMTHLIHTKISHFTKRVRHFRDKESLIELKRRKIESERWDVQEDLFQLRSKIDTIYARMHQFSQEKIALEQQKEQEQQQQQQQLNQEKEEETMPENTIVRSLYDPTLTDEEKKIQNELKERYPRQYESKQLLLQQSDGIVKL